MKCSKKILSLFVGLVMLVATMTACSTGGSTDATTTAGAAVTTTGAAVTTAGGTTSSELGSDETATLKMYGPGLFAVVGETGTTDMVTGMTRPGYEKVVQRWNELYPNVTLQIEPTPWDNWKAAIQTAALSGDYDILIHGNGNADYCLDLTDLIAADPLVSKVETFYPYRRNPQDMSEVRAYGLSYTLNPVVCIIDKKILENYSVDIPDSSWTLEDMTNIAKACTGTDPVSEKQTYGISMIKTSDAYKNYILMGRAFNNVVFDLKPKIKDTIVSFDTDKTVSVFDYLLNLGQYTSPDYIEGLDLANEFTADHNIAMIWAEDAYNMYNKIKAAGFEDQFMFLPLPKILEGDHKGITSSNVGDLNICIYKETPQKELAWDFLKFMVTDPVIQQWYVDTNSIPANVEASKLLNDVMPAEYADAISEIISTSPKGYNSSASVWYDSTWFGTFQSDIVTHFDSLLQGNETSKQVAENIQKNIDDYLKALG